MERLFGVDGFVAPAMSRPQRHPSSRTVDPREGRPSRPRGNRQPSSSAPSDPARIQRAIQKQNVHHVLREGVNYFHMIQDYEGKSTSREDRAAGILNRYTHLQLLPLPLPPLLYKQQRKEWASVVRQRGSTEVPHVKN